MPNPYSLTTDFDGFHSFVTDHELTYSIYCIDSSESFGLEEGHQCTIFQFGLNLETEVPKIPNDSRVEETVLSFISEKMSNNRNCIVYAGSPVGNKEKLRVRLFEWWFIRGRERLKDVEKYYRETANNNQAVLLIRNDCEFKEFIVSLFQS